MHAMNAAAFAAMLLVAGSGLAHHAGDATRESALVLSHAWTYENAAMADSGAVYLTIENTGDEPDRLIGAAVDFAHGALFQAPVLGADGVLRTATIAAIEIAPGQKLTLQPGGIHIVLTGLQRQHAPGSHFDLDLTFEKAGTIEIDVEVEPVGHQPDHARPAS